MGLFKQETSVSVSKKVLHAFVGPTPTSHSSDNGQIRLHVAGPQAAVARTLFVLCCRIHDSLDNLRTQSEFNEASTDICKFIMRLGVLHETSLCGLTPLRESFVVDERGALLQLYTDCRRAFYKLEPAKAILSKCVLILTAQTFRPHSTESTKTPTTTIDRQEVEFIKSCLAHAYITIPSISTFLEPKLDIYKMGLYTLGANAALVRNCLSQLDGFLKSAIRQIAETKASVLLYDVKEHYKQLIECGKVSMALNDGFHFRSYLQSHDTVSDGGFIHYVQCLVSIIAYVPSVKDDDPFYYVSALYHLLFDRLFSNEWAESEPEDDKMLANIRIQSTESKFDSKFMVELLRIRFRLLFTQLFGLWGQRQTPDKFNGVDSNNVLYSGNANFLTTARAKFTDCLRRIIIELEIWITSPDRKDTLENLALKVKLAMECIVLITPFLTWESNSIIGTNDDVVLSASLTLRMLHIVSKLWQAIELVSCPRHRAPPTVSDPTSGLKALEEAVLIQLGNLLSHARSKHDPHQLEREAEDTGDLSLHQKRAVVMGRLVTLIDACDFLE